VRYSCRAFALAPSIAIEIGDWAESSRVDAAYYIPSYLLASSPSVYGLDRADSMVVDVFAYTVVRCSPEMVFEETGLFGL
jgi:hypothetical protein